MTRPDRARLDARSAASEIAATLTGRGFVAYFAGGCVRDRLLGIEPIDYDVATDARPEQVREIFPRARSVGEAFGVMLVRRGGHTVEVATFRTDGPYGDGRHPDRVTYSDAEHDARRRDFTINGLFEDPATGAIIDHVEGRADIEQQLVRAIGDPEARLREDRLRMLRAVRFAARFRFAIETETAETIRRNAASLRGVSRERIGQELRLMLADANRPVAAWELQYLHLDGAVLDEPGCLAAPRRLGRLPANAGVPTALAAWLLDRHDRGDGRPAATAVADRWAAALMLSGAERQALKRCLAVHATLLGEWDRLGVASQKRLAASEGFREALQIRQTEDAQAFVDIRRRVEALAVTGLAPTPLITGDDLIGHGMTPGPAFQQVLDGVYDAQLEGSVRTRAQALALAEAIAAGIG